MFRHFTIHPLGNVNSKDLRKSNMDKFTFLKLIESSPDGGQIESYQTGSKTGPQTVAPHTSPDGVQIESYQTGSETGPQTVAPHTSPDGVQIESYQTGSKTGPQTVAPHT